MILWGLTCNFIKKETLAQVFFCEFCEISKNTFLYRTPLVGVSVTRVSTHAIQLRLVPDKTVFAFICAFRCFTLRQDIPN